MVVRARRQREREARREAILEAAGRTLARLGFAMTMEDVAAQAEVSKGTVYLYFPSKDALLAGFAERQLDTLLERAATVVSTAERGLDAVLGIVGEYLRFFASHPNILHTLVDWLRQPEVDDSSDDFQAYRARLQEVQAITLRAFERGMTDGSIRGDIDPLAQSLHLWATSVGVVLIQQNAPGVKKRLTLPADLSVLSALQLDTARRALEAP